MQRQPVDPYIKADGGGWLRALLDRGIIPQHRRWGLRSRAISAVPFISVLCGFGLILARSLGKPLLDVIGAAAQ